MTNAAGPYTQLRRPALSAPGLGIVVFAHALLLAALFHFNAVAPRTPLAVLSVSLMPQIPEINSPAERDPPRPKPAPRHPALMQEPDRQRAEPVESTIPAPVAAAPSPTPAAATAPTPPVQAPAPMPPRFDADYLDNPRPPYPVISRRLGEQGRLVLRVHVAPDGSAEDAQLQTSSGYQRLDESALATVRRWKFLPARIGQEAVAAWVLVPIAFTLKD